LLQQNSSAYTLQLIGLQEQEAVERFVRTHGLQGSCAYFRSLRNGRPWFSVVYGIYPDREGAVAGRSKLPAALRGTGVWPRSLASVQQAIQENRKPNP
jgi:DamX protein